MLCDDLGGSAEAGGGAEGQEGWGRCIHIADSRVAQLVRDLPAMRETWV